MTKTTAEVKRYKHFECSCNDCMIVSETGAFVLATDYDTIQQRCRELEDEIGIVSWLEKSAYWESFPQAEELLHEWALGNVKAEKIREVKKAVNEAAIAKQVAFGEEKGAGT